MNVYTTDKIRNVVLLGHGGSGKTTLVEAMAYLSGITKRMGKVTDGNVIILSIFIAKRSILVNNHLAGVHTARDFNRVAIRVKNRVSIGSYQRKIPIIAHAQLKITISRIVCIAVCTSYGKEPIAVNCHCRIALAVQMRALYKIGGNGCHSGSQTNLCGYGFLLPICRGSPRL